MPLCAPFAQKNVNLWRLHNVAQAYGQRPSQIMPTETVLADYQLDEACLMMGRRIEKRLADGEEPFASAVSPSKKNKVRSLSALATKTVKIKADGTW